MIVKISHGYALLGVASFLAVMEAMAFDSLMRKGLIVIYLIMGAIFLLLGEEDVIVKSK